AVAVIGGVGDDEGLRIDVGRTDHRRVAEPVPGDEVEVALIVRRAAEDRAGAVLPQDEGRHVDRQLPGRIERMQRLDAGVEAELFGFVEILLRDAGGLARGDEAARAGFFFAAAAASGWSGDSAMNFAPNSVSGRVVYISSSLSPVGVVFAS